jgi:hypothetical protein
MAIAGGRPFNLINLSETAGAGERGAFKSFQAFKPFKTFEATHKLKRFKSFKPLIAFKGSKSTAFGLSEFRVLFAHAQSLQSFLLSFAYGVF